MHHKAEKKWWKGRLDDPSDPDALRWHQVVKIHLEKDQDDYNSSAKVALIGYASDLGAQMNQGRLGSAHGPIAIRQALGNFAVHTNALIYDAGDFNAGPKNVESLQKEVGRYLSGLQQEQFFTVLIGGSHDLSFAHYYGIEQGLRNKDVNSKLGVINFDAHLDLRPYITGPHSGSSFQQIADYCQSQGKHFYYLCAAVQKASNTRALFKQARKLDAVMIAASDFNWHHFSQIKSALLQFIAKVDYVLLSIDMDGFRASDAPGVSAPAIAGIDPVFIQNLLPSLLATGKVLGLDVAETNPGFDIDDRTSRLAAAFIHLVVDLLD